MNTYDYIIKSIINDVTDDILQKLYIYYQILVEESKKMNLTTITKEKEVYIKHFYDSLLLSKVTNVTNKTIIDVGTGAGFPGLVLAVCFPSTNVTLVEPTLKRCNFLNHIVNELKLTNVKIINERAEKLDKGYREKFDISTARAVSNISILTELLTPFTRVNGEVVIMKGSNYQDELNSAFSAIEKLKLELKNIYDFDLIDNMGSRHILTFNKKVITPNIYPREYSKIKNKPL